MAIWAIADLHLAFGDPNKHMKVFGSQWIDYTDKIAEAWESSIQEEDLILIAGDISWAKYTEDARLDFEWIDHLPGTKVFIKGNHDYWWTTMKKMKAILPERCHLIYNNSFEWGNVSIGGSRLWDVPGLNFSGVIDFKEKPISVNQGIVIAENEEEDLKIYLRELNRLETSFKSMNPKAEIRIAMTHYPPIGLDLRETEVTKLMEKYRIDHCVFGHLHNVKPDLKLFGKKNGVDYHLTACDYLKDFAPIKIV